MNRLANTHPAHPSHPSPLACLGRAPTHHLQEGGLTDLPPTPLSWLRALRNSPHLISLHALLHPERYHFALNHRNTYPHYTLHSIEGTDALPQIAIHTMDFRRNRRYYSSWQVSFATVLSLHFHRMWRDPRHMRCLSRPSTAPAHSSSTSSILDCEINAPSESGHCLNQCERRTAFPKAEPPKSSRPRSLGRACSSKGGEGRWNSIWTPWISPIWWILLTTSARHRHVAAVVCAERLFAARVVDVVAWRSA